MFKVMILLKRRDDMSPAQFADWWLGAHAPMARALAGLRAARFNVIAGDGNGAADGIAELWFDSRDAFDAAYATEHGKAVAADSMAHVSKRERLVVDEHVVLGDAA